MSNQHIKERPACRPASRKKYKAYTDRNPKTGEQVKIKRKKLPFFKCRKELKDRVDR
ncbi:MAG: HU family DNA-binding protein [Deltaproteobacteria bacterium]|nr:HU family DNA-binding protein [Deltaproteobacteria bacterium]